MKVTRGQWTCHCGMPFSWERGIPFDLSEAEACIPGFDAKRFVEEERRAWARMVQDVVAKHVALGHVEVSP